MNLIHRHQSIPAWLNDIDRLFDRNPATNAVRETVHEAENSWILQLDLPGYLKEDMTLNLIDDHLSLTAKPTATRAFGGVVERKWKLGKDLDGSSITARLENGVLELAIPKNAVVPPQSTTITIQ